ncbi:MAG: alpha-1,4-glucan--maltose-1-phosphate maltosyltransferase [Chloroflexota bacterium]
MAEQTGKINKRVVIEGVTPEIDSGRYPIKRVVGEKVVVEADVFTDGHEAVSCELRFRQKESQTWTAVPMQALVNDRWTAEFTVTEMGQYRYTIHAWLDHFKFWAQSLVKRLDAAQDVGIELVIGANLVGEAAARAEGSDAERLALYRRVMEGGTAESIQAALSEELALLMYRYSDKDSGTIYDKDLGITVDRERARYGAWYEFFPRSCWTQDCTHGTFADCEARLPYVAGLGFNVLYLPPIHPIGHNHRKGKNNSTVAREGDVGSPWAIGSELGGHKSISPDLGTLDDFKRFMRQAAEFDIEIALDIAFQCSPDHPYVKEHPEWFRSRPDGTIQYAENPPKKYEDIYPFDFDTPHWRELWDELRSVIEYWVEQGVKIFRVDNPHTKSLRFWEWAISNIKEKYPETIFLAEAFTRPKVMYFLAKIGFTQSYNYFAWRNTRYELMEYFTELTKTEVREFFRPNLWPNTPDILTELLQVGGRPAFTTRLVLAATLGASYGIYGPAYEQCVNEPMAPGKEEYLNSEKYEIKHWDVTRPDSLAWLVSRLNSIRRENMALHSNESVRFYQTGNDAIIAYSKTTEDLSNVILTVVNLDPDHMQSGVLELPLEELGIDPVQPYQVHDLLTDNRYIWSGSHNYVELNPNPLPAHVFRVRKRVRSEQDFDYYG